MLGVSQIFFDLPLKNYPPMSWTDIFPVLDDAMLDAYREGVTEDERKQFEEWFGVARVVKGRNVEATALPVKHIVSATLFWKHVNIADPEMPPPTREMMVDAKRMGLVKRFAPWNSYVEPLLLHSKAAMEKHPHVTFRLYLAADLDFLIPELTALGWKIYLMKSPSIRYSPGGFWRFLALEDDALVTVIDTDRMGEVSDEIQRTQGMHRMGLGLWRVPGYYNSDLTKQVRYRPILGGHFGAHGGGMPVRELIECFVWHWRHRSLPDTANIPGLGVRPIQFSEWPNYGFDEWFQLAALYPRLVERGTLTFIPSDAWSLLLPIDIEYCMWANPRSEAVYF
jgi:hypothetical protein